ncbi:VapC toxin family PIN domain ribonuclease [Lamprobacter modestohalophilus]|uniref:Ribonuclease VapC n=1 Tax=Lamprobacter modestohalophilus TaxID=1064514 RepID=A0A9X1B3L6_9GAMM|nr:PIN domain-containing protein [Lamprobacter modestohalophilus]MBK1618540.1 VapC toxin family PIN domain ribonuclease [Lamprobacter modestohalophilus]
MSAEVFLDTNIFIYDLDNSDKIKQGIATQIIRSALESGTACISYQVVQECLNVALRKAEVRLDAREADAYLTRVLTPMWRIMPSEKLYRRAITIQERTRYAFYDSLIIAAALESGCSRLYSEDLQHGHEIETLRIKNPFLSAAQP